MNRTAAIITDEIQHGEEEPSLGWIGVHAFYWVTPRAVIFHSSTPIYSGPLMPHKFG